MIGFDKAKPMPALRARGMLILLLVTALPGCYREPTRWDEVQAKTRRNAPAVSKEAVPGATFNKLFPKPEGDYDVVYTQEKAGFAQAKLIKKGEDVATLSISDTVSNPEAADKYKGSSETFVGYPLIEIGELGTGLLVGNRYQVQVRSKDANFAKSDREDWLKKFDLANLARVE
jgi:hypothetical protein